MKRARFRKILALMLCLAFFIACFPGNVYAFERKEHDDLMIEILFRNFKAVENDRSVKQEIKVLECASYLCIDEFNNNGQSDLDELLNFGVSGIPSDVKEISYTAGGTDHRSYTHRGWNYEYLVKTTELWPVRKQLLINTVETVFDFEGNENQAESFSALIYYIHILGDHLDDSSYKVNNGLKMDVGGRRDKEDIIDELENNIKIVFADQRHTHKYQSLMIALDRYNSKLSEIVNSTGGINTDEKFEKKLEYTKGVANVLSLYLPEMLKNEKFFSEVFY